MNRDLCLPGTAQHLACILIWSSQQPKKYYYYPHISAEKTEAQREFSNFPWVTELTNGKDGLQTPVSEIRAYIFKLCLFCLN